MDNKNSKHEMKTIEKTKGKIIFGGAIGMSTVEAILSTRESLDALYPDRVTYLIQYMGVTHYTNFDLVDGKIKIIGGSLAELAKINSIYVADDESDTMEPLTLAMCRFSLGYILRDNAPIIITWEGSEILNVTNAIIR